MGVPVPPIELTGNGTVFMHRTQAIRTEKGPPVLRPRIIPTPSPSIFVIKPISIIVTTLTARSTKTRPALTKGEVKGIGVQVDAAFPQGIVEKQLPPAGPFLVLADGQGADS